MKTIRHWTLRYIVCRIKEWLYHRRCPDHPWLTREANQRLEALLGKTTVALETGAGRSTLWFAQRVGSLLSLEHDAEWAASVGEQLRAKGMGHVDFRLIRLDERTPDGVPLYVQAIDELPDESLDVALIDGVYRDECAVASLPKLRPGALLVIDNVNWHLPSASQSPASLGANDRPLTETWARFSHATATWTCEWTTSGVTDTALYHKPG